MTRWLARNTVRWVIRIMVKLISYVIIWKSRRLGDFFPDLNFVESDNLGRRGVPIIFKGKGIILRIVDEFVGRSFMVLFTPEGLFSCPISVGLTKEIQDLYQTGIIISSVPFGIKAEDDITIKRNRYPDWSCRFSEHYLWVKYAKQAMDMLEKIEQEKINRLVN